MFLKSTLAASTCLILAASAHAALIPITGSSFESPVLAAGAFTTTGAPGFNSGTDVGLHRIGEYGSPVANAFTDGNQLAFIGNGTNFSNMFVDVTDPAIGAPGVVAYTFTVALATRSAVGQETNGTINVGIQNLNILSNNTDNGVGIVTPVLRATLGNTVGWQQFSVTLPAAGVDPGDSIRLYIDKLAGNSLIVLDNVQLNTVLPEPTSIAALGLCATGLVRRRRAR